MWQITFCFFIIFLISVCIFAGIMALEPRTIWSGASFFLMIACLAFFLLFVLYQYSELLISCELVTGILVSLLLLAVLCMLAFPGALILTFLTEGIRVILHEGMKPVNLLSVTFSVLLCGYLAVWPVIGNFRKNTFAALLYTMTGTVTVYALSLMAVYTLSAVLNLIHLKKKRNADYIVVLGSGIIGKKVTPLLAARIDKAIELLEYNPDAILIMSGGQGAGEDIPESEAMAAYAAERGIDAKRILTERKSMSTEENLLYSSELIRKQDSKIIIVTTAYHVFRALILAKQQGIKCAGFGAKTKWYFTLNALLREFAGYFSMTWKWHISAAGILAVGIAVFSMT